MLKIIWVGNDLGVDRVIRGSQGPEVKSGLARLGSLQRERETERQRKEEKKRWVESGAVNRNSLNINQGRLSKHGRWCRGEPKQSIMGRKAGSGRVTPANIWIKYIRSDLLPPTL